MIHQCFTSETVIDKVNRLDFTLVREAWATLIKPFQWDHYFTLTFYHPATKNTRWSLYQRAILLTAMWDEFDWWMRSLERKKRGPIDWVAAPEFTTVDHLHIHGLSSGTTFLGVDVLDDYWRRRPFRSTEISRRRSRSGGKVWKFRGNANVRVYRPTGNAERYLTKRVTPKWSEIRVHIRGPAFRNMVSQNKRRVRVP